MRYIMALIALLVVPLVVFFLALMAIDIAASWLEGRFVILSLYISPVICFVAAICVVVVTCVVMSVYYSPNSDPMRTRIVNGIQVAVLYFVISVLISVQGQPTSIDLGIRIGGGIKIAVIYLPIIYLVIYAYLVVMEYFLVAFGNAMGLRSY
jgi:hypothetical protein